MHLRFGLLLSACCAISGCSEYQDPKFEIGDRKLIVVPFSEPAKKLWYGQSPRGAGMAQAFRLWVEQEWEGNFDDGPEASQAINNITRWTGEKFTPQDWRRLL